MVGWIKIFRRVFLCALLSVLIVSFLFFLSRAETRENGFSRTFENVLKKDTPPTLALGYKGYYFAGNTNQGIYLSFYQAPAHILKLNLALNDTLHHNLNLNIPRDIVFNISSSTTTVDLPFVYLADGTTGSVLKTDFKNVSQKNIMLPDSYFTSFLPITENRFLLRNYDPTIKQNVLELKGQNPDTESPKYILEKQIDGIFCTDGMLLFSKDSRLILYVYYYRNQYLIFDQELKLLYERNTIDTISQAQLKVASLPNRNQQTLSGPSKVVNRKSCISNGKLYINSALKADNESAFDYAGNSVVDVYDLTNGDYSYSFYVPKYQGETFDDFQVVNDTLVALFEDTLLSFPLVPQE